MEKRRIALQDNALGLLPEQVLVLETVGSIEAFVNAVRRIDGLEWLAEYETDGIGPEHGFHDAKKPDKELSGQVFLVMTDQQALHELERQFARWTEDATAPFAHGLAPLKHVFEQLHRIRPWGIQDRIRETGLLEDWRDRLEHDEAEIPFEAELWFRKSAGDREQAEAELRHAISASGGEVVGQSLILDIAYHAILGRLPQADVGKIIEDHESFRAIRLLRCEAIMHVRPVGQCATVVTDAPSEPLTEAELSRSGAPKPLGKSSPVVALFDGMPLAGHKLLADRLIVDDPDGYEAAYQAREREHGTSMASLICHGDLNQDELALVTPLYVRPVMQPRRGYDGRFREEIPEHVLPVDLVHRAVRRLFEPEAGEPPAAPSVRLVNLSICDPTRPFLREMSAWARLLDWLAWKYRILFIVSAGNHSRAIKLEVPRGEFDGLAPEDRERAVITAVAADSRNRSLLSPAETINGLTIGALHDDSSASMRGYLIDPFLESTAGIPSVTSAQGPGYRRAIKPDLLLSGGRQLLSEKLGTTHSQATLEVPQYSSPPGQRVAAAPDGGDVQRTRHSRGTSNATALASRAAGLVYGMLNDLGRGTDTDLPEDYDVVLTKALLAHSAAWSDAKDKYEAILRTRTNRRMFKELIGRFLGYGSANLARVMTCAPERVTVLGFGELDDGEGAVFALPLPPSLSGVDSPRRLTITLAWLSPINCSHRAYRVAHVWFNPANEIAPTRLFADHRAVQRGTLQHEVLEGHRAAVFDDGDDILIKVNCRVDAGGDIPSPVPYGLAVTLEVMGDVQESIFPASIYEEVRNRLAIPVPIREVPAV